MEFGNLGLVYSAGLLAVLAPCALPMLPSFVAYYMNVDGKKGNLFSALSFGFMTVLGFLSVFMIIGILPSFAINMVSRKIDLLAPFIGVILIIMGLGHMFSDFFYKIPAIELAAPKGTGFKAFYLYGLGYGAASMACSFPVFVLLVLQASTAGGTIGIISMFAAYGLGASTVLIPLSVALTFSRELIYEKLMQLMPYMRRINAFILILTGLYMILSYYL
jgi:cytochrome c biogenesis protein CcdA